MSRQYGCIAFTDDVREDQQHYGSAEFYDRVRSRATGAPGADPLGRREAAFLARMDGFYLATVSQTGWPYVQFRGGPPGFVSVRDAHTIGWADFPWQPPARLHREPEGDRRVAIIGVDYRREVEQLGSSPGS